MSVNLFLRIIKITEKKIYTLFIIAIIPRFEKRVKFKITRFQALLL